jgi:acetylornithine deacetylase/succinyl-diaminopimelate desuccinylase-like protein
LDVHPQPHPVSRQWSALVDWAAAGEETVQLLSAYLQVDTVNPPGNETRGARWLGAALDRDGIPWTIYEFAPDRGSIVARLRADNPTELPLCLLSHIDVVTSHADRWPADKGPLSGVVDPDGFLWGRGALDMKGMGVLELHAMSLLARLKAPLRRDVVLVAVADEEVDNQGMRQLVDHHWSDLNCGHILNEGALGVSDALFDGQTVHAVSVGEKGALWVEMVAEGEPGHGSTPRGDSALDRLRAAMDEVADLEAEPNFHPMMLELLARAGDQHGGASGFVMQRPGLVRSLARGTLMENPLTRASMTTTVHLTGLGGAEAFNVVPPKVSAFYDIRLQPGTDGDEVVHRLRRATAEIPGISFVVHQDFDGAVSEWEGDPVYGAIVAHALDGREGHVAGPFLSVGYTDSIFGRHAGARAYGYVPLVVDADLLATMHGDAERVPVSELKEGVRRMFGMLVEAAVRLDAPVAAAPGGPLVKPAPGADARAPWPSP